MCGDPQRIEVHTMAGAIDQGLRKFHASLNVSDLDRSIAFYRVLLGTEPAKVRSDYAKFDLAEPPLVLSLIPGRPGNGGNLNHAGLRVRSAEELVEIQRRLEAAGLHTEREEGVECCYARQTKFWVTDPDRALWEIYIFHDDIDDHGSARPPRVEPLRIETAASAAPLAWEHRLSDPVPSRIPHDDNTLYQIRLEGSINAASETDHRSGLLSESLRALRPGAPIYLHGLAGDRRSASSPALPGPAAAVQHVPAAGDVIDDLVRAGFVDIQIEKLSETAYFVVDGVAMRELRVAARKPGYRPARATHEAVYLGPMAQVTDDFGNVFRRGVATPLNIHDWQVLSKGAASAAFLLLKPDATKAATCCGTESAPPATAAGGQSGLLSPRRH
jgi:catechol 2,3-dioxygenase-like lactoylglutathione lyase family enzyme